MRGLIFLLVVVLSFLLVLKFYGASPSEASASGGEVGEVSEEPETGFLLPPRDSRPAAAVQPQVEPEQPTSGPEDQDNGKPSWLQELKPVSQERPWGIPIAKALAHAGLVELDRSMAKVDEEALSEADRELLRAFIEVLTGERQAAEKRVAGLDESEVDGGRLNLLKRAFGASVSARSASAGGTELSVGMRHRLLVREAGALLEARDYPAAARAYSDLLLGELDAPWESDRSRLADYTAGLKAAQKEHRWNPRSEWAHDELVVQAGDHLTAIRARYVRENPGRLMCTGLIERANRLGRYIHEGDRLHIPRDRASARVDLSARWTLYMLGDEVADAWPVGIGRTGDETIRGVFVAGEKEMEPMWWRPGQDPVPYGDPENALGSRWIEWYRDGTQTSYGFHGTNDPASIGTASSEGCVRMRNEDVEVLFEILPLGAEIHVRD